MHLVSHDLREQKQTLLSVTPCTGDSQTLGEVNWAHTEHQHQTQHSMEQIGRLLKQITLFMPGLISEQAY